jgi:hypothetical protein
LAPTGATGACPQRDSPRSSAATRCPSWHLPVPGEPKLALRPDPCLVPPLPGGRCRFRLLAPFRLGVATPVTQCEIASPPAQQSASLPPQQFRAARPAGRAKRVGAIAGLRAPAHIFEPADKARHAAVSLVHTCPQNLPKHLPQRQEGFQAARAVGTWACDDGQRVACAAPGVADGTVVQLATLGVVFADGGWARVRGERRQSVGHGAAASGTASSPAGCQMPGCFASRASLPRKPCWAGGWSARRRAELGEICCGGWRSWPLRSHASYAETRHLACAERRGLKSFGRFVEVSLCGLVVRRSWECRRARMLKAASPCSSSPRGYRHAVLLLGPWALQAS